VYHNKNLKVMIVEKEGRVGGNSAKASSGINAAVSNDDIEVFTQDTLKSGLGYSNETLAKILAVDVRLVFILTMLYYSLLNLILIYRVWMAWHFSKSEE